MKKFLFLFLTLAISTLTGCQKDGNDTTPTPNYRYQCTNSGIYLSATGFNSRLHTKKATNGNPFMRLTEYSIDDFKSFINSLSIDDGTILYYSMEDAISQLAATQFPDNLQNVSIITFTDGLDQGSTAMNSNYTSANDYLSAISSMLQNTRINGNKINAYSIGLKGNDVANETLFQQNLEKLASSHENAMKVSNISELNTKFQELANSLHSESFSQSLTLTIPQPYEHTKIRFTFDVSGSGSVDNSRYYIEGIYESNALTAVKYSDDVLCNSGSTVPVSSKSGINISFVFKDLEFKNGFTMSVENIKQWEWVETDSGIWQVNSEFNPNRSTQTTIEENTAVIMLLLDCSGSLGDDVEEMKAAANNFINTLLNGEDSNSQDDGYQEPSPTITTIADIYNYNLNGIYTVTDAWVVANYENGFIMTDASGEYILVYQWNSTLGRTTSPVPDVGTKLTSVTGVIETRPISNGNMLQFNSTTQYEADGTVAVQLGNPKRYDYYTLKDYGQLSGTSLRPVYAVYNGTLQISGTYYNIYFSEGSSPMGSISYPNTSLNASSYNGLDIEVTGFLIGYSQYGYYINTCATSIREN